MYPLREILIPVYDNDDNLFSQAHHRVFFDFVRSKSIGGGYTERSPVKGKWWHKGELYAEEMIPVEVTCSPGAMNAIARFALKHYRQKYVRFMTLSNECHITDGSDLPEAGPPVARRPVRQNRESAEPAQASLLD